MVGFVRTLQNDKQMEEVSDCCGAAPVGASKDMGLCPECRDHCEYTDGQETV